MGNPGSFKSAMWKILKNAKTRRGEKTTVVDFSPKAISTNELYGFVNLQTREWKDEPQSLISFLELLSIGKL